MSSLARAMLAMVESMDGAQFDHFHVSKAKISVSKSMYLFSGT